VKQYVNMVNVARDFTVSIKRKKSEVIANEDLL